jgi:hypothetical protein
MLEGQVMMTLRHRLQLGSILLGALTGCASSPEATGPSTSAPPASSEPSPASTIHDVMELEPEAALEPGAYFIDPDLDPDTPLRVMYEVPVEGWSRWIGAVKFAEPDPSHVAVSITTVANLVRHGCRDHSWAEPPVGASVADLATALADLPPFRVTSPPEDVTVDGYDGKHLELTVPNLPLAGDDHRFTGCIGGHLKSWVGAIDTAEEGDAFYGYTGPGYREEFWILDVEGTRLMIASGRSPGSPPEDLAELGAIINSIRIEPQADPGG